MVSDPAEVGRLAESKKSENLAFGRYLRAHHYQSGPFQILAGEIEKQFDCTACGNCCRHMAVTVSKAEVENIATYLRMPVEEVYRLYTTSNPSGERFLVNEHDSCIFLDGNLCMIYEVRPDACRAFPHVAPGTHSLGSRYSSLRRHASICPIIYNALESYKQLIGYGANRERSGFAANT